jgi:aminoglycoside 6'-N-acetyltransferase I
MEIRPPAAADLGVMAELLVAGFRRDWPTAFPDLDAARAAVDEVLTGGFARVAAEGARVLGWIGGLPQYEGRVIELHPLVVAVDRQGQGIGTALVRDLEACARARGALTIVLGSDDESDLTSLSGVDLYDDLPGRIAAASARRHPLVFYRKLGYVVCGVIPDANGRGKPDILLCKRV